MFSRIAAGSKALVSSTRTAIGPVRLIRHAAGVLLRRDARIGRWAGQVLPPNRILWHGGRLARFATRLEKRFLHASSGLESLASSSNILLERSRKLLKYSLVQDGASTFQAAVTAMEQPLAFNDECLEITDKLDRNLESVAARIGSLHRFKSSLDESIAPLTILQTLFRIESAASPPEVHSLFTTLSAEIERLVVRMSTLIASEFEMIASAGETLNGVINRLREVRALQVKAQARRSEIGGSLRLLEAQLETNRERDVRLTGATLAVSEKLAGMVTALQYQDILNQRLEHVTRGLEEIASRSRELENGAQLDGLSYLRDAASVEAAQLEDVEGVLGGAVESLRSALAGLAEEMGTLGTECLLLDGVEASSGASDGMVQILLNTIRENLELTESTAVRSEGIFVVLEPIGGLMGSLTGSILELSARIRLIALNAQIQAVQAGAGTGLEVLSGRARAIAEQIDQIVAEIADELAGLKDGLKQVLDDVEYTRARSLKFLQFLREDGKEHEARLHDFRDRLLAELWAVGDLIALIQVEARNLAGSLDLRTETQEIVSAVRGELQQFSGELAARLGRRARSSGMDGHARFYTAASERAAHERALRSDGPGGPALSPVMACTAEGSVELF